MKKVVFLTGTRADFGKLKSLIRILEDHSDFAPYLFVTGMHLLEEYGYTLIEVERAGFTRVHTYSNHTSETTMDLTLAKTMEGFSEFIKEVAPDLIVVHGDRVEALAGASVGALNNILVAHIEGGEVSGTIDELIRHATSKMSHIHFVSNKSAKNRLLQMGELPQSVHVIGSPDVDIMFSENLPTLAEAKEHYEIPFSKFALAMFHPVTTEFDHMGFYAQEFVNAILDSGWNYIVIYPNNDLGSTTIMSAFEKFRNQQQIRMFPSIRFEYFLTFLKNASFIIGNSSAGIREAPYYGTPTVNIGTRQQNRSLDEHIINSDYNSESIIKAITGVSDVRIPAKEAFGVGDSNQLFLQCLCSDDLWEISHQKLFKDI